MALNKKGQCFYVAWGCNEALAGSKRPHHWGPFESPKWGDQFDLRATARLHLGDNGSGEMKSLFRMKCVRRRDV